LVLCIGPSWRCGAMALTSFSAGVPQRMAVQQPIVAGFGRPLPTTPRGMAVYSRATFAPPIYATGVTMRYAAPVYQDTYVEMPPAYVTDAATNLASTNLQGCKSEAPPRPAVTSMGVQADFSPSTSMGHTTAAASVPVVSSVGVQAFASLASVDLRLAVATTAEATQTDVASSPVASLAVPPWGSPDVEEDAPSAALESARARASGSPFAASAALGIARAPVSEAGATEAAAVATEEEVPAVSGATMEAASPSGGSTARPMGPPRLAAVAAPAPLPCLPPAVFATNSLHAMTPGALTLSLSGRQGAALSIGGSAALSSKPVVRRFYMSPAMPSAASRSSFGFQDVAPTGQAPKVVSVHSVGLRAISATATEGRATQGLSEKVSGGTGPEKKRKVGSKKGGGRKCPCCG